MLLPIEIRINARINYLDKLLKRKLKSIYIKYNERVDYLDKFVLEKLNKLVWTPFSQDIKNNVHEQ